MDAEKGIIIFFVLMILAGVFIYYSTHTKRIEEQREELNEVCEELTVKLNEQNELKNETNRTCVEYFCYYEAYAPPEGLEETQTMCVCECRLEDGRVTKVQVLTPKPTY